MSVILLLSGKKWYTSRRGHFKYFKHLIFSSCAKDYGVGPFHVTSVSRKYVVS